jgi:cytoskeletal protein CcmA (bactofilin family)
MEDLRMWNKRKEEENAPRQAPAPQPASYGATATNMPSSPAPSYHPEASRGMAVIGKSVTIKGQIFSQEDLTIDGEMEGSVELKEHRLTVGPNGKIQAGIKAREIVVLGAIHGNVEASDKIDIRKEARLVGDIKTSRIVIEDGAYFKGSIDITRGGTAEPAPKPVATAPAATPSQPRPQPQQQSIAQNAGK